MNPVSVDIKDILEAELDLGLEFATSLFIGREPSQPNNCVTLFDVGGLPPAPMMEPQTYRYHYEPFQIRVRNISYEAAYEEINNIYRALHGRANETWNGTVYTSILCTSGPAFLEWDENNRCKFIINFLAQRRG